MQWSSRLGSATLLVAALGAVAASVFTNAAVGAAQSVRINSFSYQPSTLTVPIGSSVTWTNDDAVPHSVTADTASFDSSPGCTPSTTQPCLAQGATFSRTFRVGGTFSYHCLVHSFMHGTIVVTAAPTGAVAAPASPGGRATFASNATALGLLGVALVCAGAVVFVAERRPSEAQR